MSSNNRGIKRTWDMDTKGDLFLKIQEIDKGITNMDILMAGLNNFVAEIGPKDDSLVVKTIKVENDLLHDQVEHLKEELAEKNRELVRAKNDVADYELDLKEARKLTKIQVDKNLMIIEQLQRCLTANGIAYEFHTDNVEMEANLEFKIGSSSSDSPTSETSED